MKISILLPVFNRKDELQRSLRALIPEKGEHEIFVVDLGSTDGSQEVARSHEWAQVIPSKEVLRSKALNEAVEKTTGEILFFLEPGSMPARGWSRALEAHYESAKDAGYMVGREVDASAKWVASLRSLSLKAGHQLLGGPASLNGVTVSREYFDKVSGFRPVPDFEWLAFAARLKESGAKIKAVKHELLVSPAAGHRQANAWQDLKEDLISAWKFRSSESYDAKRNRRKASCAVIFGYDAFEKPEGTEFFQHAQQSLQKIILEVMQSYRGVDKLYFIGGNASTKLIGQPSGVEVIGKPRSSLEKRFAELLEKIRAENQEGLLLVKSNSLDLNHRKLHELSEGKSEESCVILPEADSEAWTALWFEQPALDALADWELNPGIAPVKAHMKSKIIRQDEEAPVKSLKNDSDARGLYYRGVLDMKPA